MRESGMRIAIVFGSQRKDGTNNVIEERLRRLDSCCEYDFIRMAELKIEGCTACANCSGTGQCIIDSSDDDFENVLTRLIKADVILIVTPIYSPYPSRLTALMERLLSISYFPYEYDKRKRPLLGKATGIICYGSSKIEDEKQLKLLFQKYLMDSYSFTEISYKYINDIEKPNEKYSDVVEYVEDVITNLVKK
jgi:multimeric flavodoxin WrbA